MSDKIKTIEVNENMWYEKRRAIIRLQDVNGQLVRALQEFLDFHVNQAGITPEIIADKDNFDAFLANIEKREKQMVEQAQSALAAANRGAA